MTDPAEQMEKLKKKLEDTFIEECRASTVEKLRDKVVDFSKRLEDIKDEKKKDAKLGELKEMLKDLNGAYKDAEKAVSVKLQYIILMLKDRGNL